MFDVLLFAGTSEGRMIAEYLRELPVRACVFTATEYGGSLIRKGETLSVREGRLDREQMEALFLKEKEAVVLDATHPYASEVTSNLKKACENTGREYIRITREKGNPSDANAVYFDSPADAAEYLNHTEGNILVTTGSKELKAFQAVDHYRERIYARVLSLGKVVKACEEMGFRGRHLICMQGPFSKEMNIATLKEYDIRYLVTKDAGAAGGYPEKEAAALACGCRMIVISRPEEEDGLSPRECMEYLKNRYGNDRTDSERNTKSERRPVCNAVGDAAGANDQTVRTISIVGTGMSGETSGMTVEGREICRNADIIIGAERIADAAAFPGQKILYEYRPGEIAEHIHRYDEYVNIVIVMSGDTGFFSGAKKLLERFHRTGIKVNIYPGLSSLSYFTGRIGEGRWENISASLHGRGAAAENDDVFDRKMTVSLQVSSWEDADICSLHGRTCNLIGHVLKNEKVFCILGRKEHISGISKKFLRYGMNDLLIFLGERLGYPEEKILLGRPEDFAEYENDPLAVVLIINAAADHRTGTRIPDEFFVRDKVPMTKEEIRTISVAKLDISKDDIIYDVGAGSGSVTMEMASAAIDGMVYAIEKNETALSLIEENKGKCKCDNVVIVPGEAPCAMADLPAPDAVFIGGSGGNLPDIVRDLKEKNPNVRLVINAVTIETIGLAMQALKEEGFHITGISCVSVSRAKEVGEYHLMLGQNPVYIITAESD